MRKRSICTWFEVGQIFRRWAQNGGAGGEIRKNIRLDIVQLLPGLSLADHLNPLSLPMIDLNREIAAKSRKKESAKLVCACYVFNSAA